MSFASGASELRREALIMLETRIVMSSLIFHLVVILVLYLALLLVFCPISLMDLTIAHMVLVHERTTLCLYGLVTAHVLIKCNEDFRAFRSSTQGRFLIFFAVVGSKDLSFFSVRYALVMVSQSHPQGVQ
jgi:hypothetical protein